MISIILSFILGTFTGIYLYRNLNTFNEKLKRIKKIQEINDEFKKLLQTIKTDTTFKSRYNSTIYLEANLEKHGLVEIIYMLDKKDIVVIKDNLCLLTTESVDKQILSDITNTIESKFNDNINDVIEVMGCTLSREHFEKTFNSKINELNLELDNLEKQLSDTEKIVAENKQKFDIDEILDKISNKGIDSLTENRKRIP